MRSLESIVASLELCRKIPAGEFEDTALVWIDGNTQNPEYVFVEPRRYAIDGTFIPAPTLEEILDEMVSFRASFCVHGMAIGNNFYGYPTSAEEALRLWFKVKGIEVE